MRSLTGIPHSLALLLQIFHMMKDKRHFEQQHGSPADSAGSSDASDADPAGKQEGADGAQGDLNECAENGNRNLSHPSAVSLETVGKTGKCINQSHDGKIGCSFTDDFRSAVSSDKQGNEMASGYHDCQTDQDAVAEFHGDTCQEAFSDSVRFFSAAVLGNTCGDCRGDPLFGNQREAVYSADRVEGGDCADPEKIDL